jgi:hypothetical protein
MDAAVAGSENQPDIEFFTIDDKPFGLSYGRWTVRWWEWALSIPMPNNPVLDDTGKYAAINQSGPVWFLAGTIGDENKIAHRRCYIPAEKAILFPIINYIYTFEPKFNNDSELVKYVASDIDDIVTKETVVDGKTIPPYRVTGEPSIFILEIKERNKLDIPLGINKAAADGYWVFLKPVPRGEHEIRFQGACSGGIRKAAANYHIISA